MGRYGSASIMTDLYVMTNIMATCCAILPITIIMVVSGIITER